MNTAWNDYFHGQYLAARAYVFSRVFLAMLALDTWMLMIGHAGRYGVASFNVSHIPLFDRILPVPTPTLYIAVLLLTGLLSLTLALIGVRRAPALILCLLYTYSWSMSMLDSYQHHYFVSLVLLCLVFFPNVTLHDLAVPKALTRSFGYPLLASTVSVLYTFTAVAKMDAQWCDGFTLRRISSSQEVFAPLLKLAQQLGMTPETFWSVASVSVIPLELLIAAGYFVSARQDTTTRGWLRVCCNLTFPLALSLHVGAEALRLDIGWFSYYMIMLACTFLLPGRAVTSLSRLISLPAQLVARLVAEPTQLTSPGASSRDLWLTCAAVSGVLGAAAFLIDLPGAPAAACLGAVGLIGYVVIKGRHEPSAAQQVALALGVAGVLMWTTIALTEARWDYYRYLGGDLQRRGESRAALEAYLKGERYAPQGSSRRAKIQELQRELGLPVSR